MGDNTNLATSYSIDRTIKYGTIDYKIVEILNSEMLLVVKKEEFDKKIFPLQTYVIPGQ